MLISATGIMADKEQRRYRLAAGFSLLEILVVIVIVSIVQAVVVVVCLGGVRLINFIASVYFTFQF